MAKKATATKREVETVINPYEIMLILNPELRESEIKKKLKEITGVIEKAGGKITHEDFWDKKDLAYKIKKHWEGIYMVYNLELPNTFLNELKNHLRIEKDILRSMLLALPSDYTYTKYELEVEEEPKKEFMKKKVIIKKVEPVTPIKKKEEVKSEKEEKEVGTQDLASEKDEEKEAEKTEGEPTDDTAEMSPPDDGQADDAVETDQDPSPDEKTEEKPEEPKKAAKKTTKAKKEKKEEEKEEVKSEKVEDEEREKKEKEEKEEVKSEKVEDEEREKKEKEAELDEKLDKLLGGEDLNL